MLLRKQSFTHQTQSPLPRAHCSSQYPPRPDVIIIGSTEGTAAILDVLHKCKGTVSYGYSPSLNLQDAYLLGSLPEALVILELPRRLDDAEQQLSEIERFKYYYPMTKILPVIPCKSLLQMYWRRLSTVSSVYLTIPPDASVFQASLDSFLEKLRC